jgi:hypothetical protein
MGSVLFIIPVAGIIIAALVLGIIVFILIHPTWLDKKDQKPKVVSLFPTIGRGSIIRNTIDSVTINGMIDEVLDKKTA